MKKMEKAMYVVRMMAAAIEDAKVKFSEIEEARARITIANAKLAKKETKKWRTELERATNLLNYHKGRYYSAVSRVNYYNGTTIEEYMKKYKLV